MRYHRLTREERYQIAILVKSGMSIRSTAAQLGRSASTISRELKRNYTKLGTDLVWHKQWLAEYADLFTHHFE